MRSSSARGNTEETRLRDTREVTTSIPPLAGYCVAVTADRRCEEQVTLLQRRGAATLVGPTIRTLPLVEDDELAEAIDSIIDHPPDVTVLLTGIGTRGMLAAAEGMGKDVALVRALQSTRVMARGPKAAGAAMTAGLSVEWQTPNERAVELLEHLRVDAASGARIAVQRDGQLHASLAGALAALGADAVDVPVYRWELPDDLRPALRLASAIVDRCVDAVTFTSSPALRHLVSLAGDAGIGPDVIDAFASGDVLAACVGPVCAETAAELGVKNVLAPNRARLGAMVQALAVVLGGRGRTVSTSGGEVTIRSRAVFVDGALSSVGTRERSVLAVLADADGAVVPKARLLRAVWGPDFDDEHAVEVAVARLRRGLGAVGAAVETVPRRGYRLAG